MSSKEANALYTQEDLQQADAMFKRRLLAALLPAVLVIVLGVALFVIGRIHRSDTMWMWTAALTILGGGYFLFGYGVAVKPARIYRTHVGYMLNGRQRETTGVFKSFSEETSDRDGLICHAMMLNVGEVDDPEDDRLFYYDAYKPKPDMPLGTRVTVRSNDKAVSSMQRA